jgi:hypothetical protein
MSPSSAKKRLMELPGIGPYSADIATPHPSFPVDTWSARIFGFLFGFGIEGGFAKLAGVIRQYAESEFGVWQRFVHGYTLHDLEHLDDVYQISDSLGMRVV